MLLKNGFICSTLVGPAWIEQKLQTVDLTPDLRQLLGVMHVKGNPPEVSVPGTKRTTLTVKEQIDEYRIEETEFSRIDDSIFLFHLRMMLSQNATSHAPHRIGLYLYLLFGLPMKADLYKTSSLGDIARVVSFRNPEMLRCANDFYMSKSQRYMLGTRRVKIQKRRSEL